MQLVTWDASLCHLLLHCLTSCYLVTRYLFESSRCKCLPLTAVRGSWSSPRRSVFDTSCAIVRDFQSSDYEMLSALDEPGQGQPRRRLPEAALASLPSHVHPGPLPPAVAGPPLLGAAGLPCSSRWSGLACISPFQPVPSPLAVAGPPLLCAAGLPLSFWVVLGWHGAQPSVSLRYSSGCRRGIGCSTFVYIAPQFQRGLCK